MNQSFYFKVRKWSETATRPYDVVLVDVINNNVHHQPEVDFSTPEKAGLHLTALEKSAKENDDSINFIRDHWPVDGAVE